MTKTTLLFAMLALSGCAPVGIEPGYEYPTENFTASVSYQEAYRRAETAIRQCQATKFVRSLPITVSGQIYTDKEAGTLRVNTTEWYSDLERVEVSAIDAHSSTVKITVFDKYQWDREEIRALRRSIETGTVICRPSLDDRPSLGRSY